MTKAIFIYIILFVNVFVSTAQDNADTDSFFYLETFDERPDIFRSKWMKSSDPKYADQPIMVKSADHPPKGYGRDKGLSLTQEMKYYGVYSKFSSPLSNEDGSDIVIQYEVKLEESLLCGGAYIKLPRTTDTDTATTTTTTAQSDSEINSDTPYSIMFGPDKCGVENDRVHFIIQYQNPNTFKWEESHYKSPPTIIDDQLTHLYTLILYGYKNNNGNKKHTFDIMIDTKMIVEGGSLIDDMVPTIVPLEFIDDPNDIKPDTWEDEEEIIDINAKKPNDWDNTIDMMIPDPSDSMPVGWLENENLEILDPDAYEPDDWDIEEDGEWESPSITNPICHNGDVPGCGPWRARRIPNPDYKGEWKPPMIKNPNFIKKWITKQIKNPLYDYFNPKNINTFIQPSSGILLEVWTTNAGIHFDNFLIDYNINNVNLYAKKTFLKKSIAEQIEFKRLEDIETKEKIQLLKQSGDITSILKALLIETATFLHKNWMIVLGSVTGVFFSVWITLVYYGNNENENEDEDENENENENVDLGVETSEDEDEAKVMMKKVSEEGLGLRNGKEQEQEQKEKDDIDIILERRVREMLTQMQKEENEINNAIFTDTDTDTDNNDNDNDNVSVDSVFEDSVTNDPSQSQATLTMDTEGLRKRK
jgi:calnexin